MSRTCRALSPYGVWLALPEAQTKMTLHRSDKNKNVNQVCYFDRLRSATCPNEKLLNVSYANTGFKGLQMAQPDFTPSTCKIFAVYFHSASTNKKKNPTVLSSNNPPGAAHFFCRLCYCFLGAARHIFEVVVFHFFSSAQTRRSEGTKLFS